MRTFTYELPITRDTLDRISAAVRSFRARDELPSPGRFEWSSRSLWPSVSAIAVSFLSLAAALAVDPRFPNLIAAGLFGFFGGLVTAVVLAALSISLRMSYANVVRPFEGLSAKPVVTIEEDQITFDVGEVMTSFRWAHFEYLALNAECIYLSTRNGSVWAEPEYFDSPGEFTELRMFVAERFASSRTPPAGYERAVGANGR